MGKKRVIAETGAGQHGVATATVCALLGLECVVYMGDVDMERQELNVLRMRLLGAEVRGVSSGSKTLKDAISEAMRDWVTNVRTTYYLLGSALGAHPYPTMVRDFHRVHQPRDRRSRFSRRKAACPRASSPASAADRTPSARSTSSSTTVRSGSSASKPAAAAPRSASTRRAFSGGAPGVLQGTYSYVLQDEDGQIALTHSVSAGLDYASIGPEHAALHDSGRAEYVSQDDAAALDAVVKLARTEGILPALESAHAVAEALRIAPTLPARDILVVNLSGRGDKDMGILARELKLYSSAI